MLCCISFSNDTDFQKKRQRTDKSLKKKDTNKIHSDYVGSLVTMLVLHGNIRTKVGQKSGNDWTNTSARDNWWQIINHHHSHRHHRLKTYFGTKKENGDQLIFNFTLSSGPTLDKANRGSQTRARWWARCSGCKLQWLKKTTQISWKMEELL